MNTLCAWGSQCIYQNNNLQLSNHPTGGKLSLDFKFGISLLTKLLNSNSPYLFLQKVITEKNYFKYYYNYNQNSLIFKSMISTNLSQVA